MATSVTYRTLTLIRKQLLIMTACFLTCQAEMPPAANPEVNTNVGGLFTAFCASTDFEHHPHRCLQALVSDAISFFESKTDYEAFDILGELCDYMSEVRRPQELWTAVDGAAFADPGGYFPDGNGGILIVFTLTANGTVCDDQFDEKEAQVVCDSMFGSGLSRAHVIPRSEYQVDPADQATIEDMSILMDEVSCTGNEDSLDQCQYSRRHDCDHAEDVVIKCAMDGDSMVLGSMFVDPLGRFLNNNGGVLVVVEDNTHKVATVCDDKFGHVEAQVVCDSIYGSGYYVGRTVPSHKYQMEQTDRGVFERMPILMDEVNCTGSEVDIGQCQFKADHNCQHTEDVVMACYNPSEVPMSLEFADPIEYFPEGRGGVLTVSIGNQLGTVCDDDYFGDPDAQIICNDLFGEDTYTGYVMHRMFYGMDREDRDRIEGLPISIYNVDCSGSEDSLDKCPHSEGHPCQPGQYVVMACLTAAEKKYKIMFDDPENTFPEDRGGVLIVKSRIHQGTVCDYNFDPIDAQLVCDLRFGVGTYLARMVFSWDYNINDQDSQRIQEMPMLMDDVSCTGNENNLAECRYDIGNLCHPEEYIVMGCLTQDEASWKIKLDDPDQFFPEGRGGILIVSNAIQKGTVCDDKFDKSDAQAICDMKFNRGKYNGYVLEHTEFPLNEVDADRIRQLPILMDDVECQGTENNLSECPHSSRNNCWHGEDVVMACLTQNELKARMTR